MAESQTDNISMVVVDSVGAGEAREARTTHRTEEEPLPEREDFRSRVHDRLVAISALAVPLLIVTLLLFPAVIVVALLVGICILPSILVLCMGCMLYIFCPETSSTFALLWGSGASQRRWDMDWTLTNYMESLEPRSRADLETSLVVKTVVKGGLSEESEIEEGADVKFSTEDETKVSESRADEEESIQKAVDIESDKSDIETGDALQETKSPKRETVIDFDFDPKTMVHLNQISKSCCDICMMDYELDDKISQSKNVECDHIFHKECILDWMQKKHTCPCCRRNYLGEDNHDNVAAQG
mmetsp:Transcript_29982/g.49503  ORF Transcript_29982/g.49503 Transcript_29982/m.49503 type:complete len:299 (-) Transcript_29982:49-945(-)|eukprot:CAMPEP_0119013624 /NCGR_PEP_ID=MMETSP1176-20130426/8619_1 /TAXON_ID=265551 /ORGANISM="Synedropsis recta cf, Strain CCMP1620" /LENGTH=298 /DNA_ID=CAMNT_0006966727 /DNA_START=111 /DNA_END=1007 /DNA_ORIENTATION=+